MQEGRRHVYPSWTSGTLLIMTSPRATMQKTQNPAWYGIKTPLILEDQPHRLLMSVSIICMTQTQATVRSQAGVRAAWRDMNIHARI